VSPALANFLFEAVNLLLLAAALGWILFKPVRRALDEERARHAKEEEEQKRLRSEAEALARDARAVRGAADREAAERRSEVLAAAQKDAVRIVEEARKSQAAERRALEQELATSRNAQAAAVADAVGRIAGESVARLLDALEGPSLDVALVRAACAELGALPTAARGSALVESARPLEAEARRLLGGALGDGFKERTVSELLAGVRVTTSAGQVDATALSLARHAAQAVTASLERSVTPTGGTDG
jgi:F0F1-type ATP synthase membrane subunit b/b'